MGGKMDSPTQEQVHKFWEWCGLTFKEDDTTFTGWRDSDGKLVCCGHTNRSPDLNLDNFFLYAVPKLQDKGYQIDIVCFKQKGFSVSLWDVTKNEDDSFREVKDNSLTRALFWVIWRVIQ
jgi:hypothetical protein